MPLVEKLRSRLARSSSKDLLTIHTLLASQILQSLNREASTLRANLLQDVSIGKTNIGCNILTAEQEHGKSIADPKAKTENLHRNAQEFHIAVENFADLEGIVNFLIGASEKIRLAIDLTPPMGTTNEADMLFYLLSEVQYSKRWVSNYRDRANIRINLVRYLLASI